MKIPLSEAEAKDRGEFVARVYHSGTDQEDFSLLLVEVHGRHPRKLIEKGTRTYTVVGGGGTFTVDGEVHDVQLYDTFMVRAGHDYEYEGDMKLVETNVPASGTRDRNLDTNPL